MVTVNFNRSREAIVACRSNQFERSVAETESGGWVEDLEHTAAWFGDRSEADGPCTLFNQFSHGSNLLP
jgi:hypothetical protein